MLYFPIYVLHIYTHIYLLLFLSYYYRKAMAELITTGDCKCINLKPFYPDRYMTKAGLKNRGRKKGDLSVGEQW